MDITHAPTGAQVRVNALFYGSTGVGKTTLLGSAQDCDLTSPCLFMNVDGGVLSLAGSKIDIVRPSSFTEIQEIYDFLRFDNDEYRSVSIDTVTEIQRQLSMGGILGDLEDDASYKDLAGHKPPDRYDWLQSGEQMRKFIRAFRDLAYLDDESRRIHVFIAALEKTDRDRMVVCPNLPGALGPEIGGAVDFLARMSVQKVLVGEAEEEQEVRNLCFANSTDEDSDLTYLGKVRKPVQATFPNEIWNPTVSKILGKWMKATAAVAGKSRRRKSTKR